MSPPPGTQHLPSPARRRLLKLVVALAALPGQVHSDAPLDTELPSFRQETLAAFVDTLLPRDHLGGSASDLGVDREILTFAQSSSLFLRLLDLGTRWLNQTGGPPFHKLDNEQKNRVVEWMSTAAWESVPGRFYVLIRQLAIEFYYSQSEALGGLSIHPPQPQGYPPPWT